MKFILVNDRALKDSYCALCCDAIRAEYLRDLETRLRDARRIGEREISLRRAGLGRNDLDFSRASERMVFESILATDHEERAWHPSKHQLDWRIA